MNLSYRLLTASFLAASFLAGPGWTGAGESHAADNGSDPTQHRKHHHGKAGTKADPALVASAASAVPGAPAENLIVRGQKRFISAPMPNQQIHDPADVLRDPSTGAPMGKFGGAYNDANPVPQVNPQLRGDQSPINAGVQR